jgi:predicted small secreted protein
MIKKIFFFAALAFAVAACNNAGQDGQDEAMTVGELLEQAEGLVDQTISVEGVVIHVCAHGGERLFIADAEGNEIKVESGENIPQFDVTLEGTEIVLEAIVRELRIDEAYLQEWEAELAAEEAEMAADTVSVEGVVEEAIEEVKEVAEEAVEMAEEAAEEVMGEEDHAHGEDHPEMHGKEDHHMDARTKIAKYREEIAASEKGYLSRYWLEAVSFTEKVMEDEEVVIEEEAVVVEEEMPEEGEATMEEGEETTEEEVTE